MREAQTQAERKITSGHAQHAAEQRKINCGSKRPDVWTAAQHEPDCLWHRDAINVDAYGPHHDTCTCGPICDWPQDDGYGPHEGRILRHRWWVRMPSTDPWRRFVWDSWRGWYVSDDGRWVATDDKIPSPVADHGDLKPKYDAPISSGGQATAMRKHMSALGALDGSASGFISNSSVSGPLCWPVRDRNGKIVHHGAGPIYDGKHYTEAWDTARAKLGIDSMLVRRRYLGPLVCWGERLIGCLEGTDEGIAACRASKKCHYCGAYFVAKHGKAKFCNDAHRQRYHHNKGPMERPVFRCDELAPTLRWATPTLVDLGSPHDVRCLWRRKAIAETSLDFCTCSMTFEKAVTIRRQSKAETPAMSAKYEDGQAMAA
jgi:hypothetical protein